MTGAAKAGKNQEAKKSKKNMTDIIDKRPDGAGAPFFGLIERTCETAMHMFGVAHGLVSVAVVDDAAMQDLNLRCRGLDRPTDVLSFAAREGAALVSPKKGEYLGDIAVNLDAARRQGQTYGHGLTRELAFLCAHGMLHLLGYDHMEPVEEREMRALQNDIMNQLGLSVKEAPQQE